MKQIKQIFLEGESPALIFVLISKTFCSYFVATCHFHFFNGSQQRKGLKYLTGFKICLWTIHAFYFWLNQSFPMIIRLAQTQNFPKTNISYLLICTRTCEYQGVRNVSFSENCACVLNEWSPEKATGSPKRVEALNSRITLAAFGAIGRHRKTVLLWRAKNEWIKVLLFNWCWNKIFHVLQLFILINKII